MSGSLETQANLIAFLPSERYGRTPRSGVRIQGVTHKKFAALLQTRISVGSVYDISNYSFRSPRPTLRTCRYPRWLDLTPSTKFTLHPSGDPFNSENFELIPFSKFPGRLPSCAYLTDFVGKLISVGKPNYVEFGSSVAPVQTLRLLMSGSPPHRHFVRKPSPSSLSRFGPTTSLCSSAIQLT